MAVSFTLSRAGLEVYTTQDDPEIKLSDSTESNFTLLNGEVNQIDYIGELYSDSYEQDYSDISSNASISLPVDYYSTLFKGKKIALKKGISPNKWEDMETAVLGFVTEISYSKDKIDIKINGMDKLLDQEKKFSFTKTKRSMIVKKIIEAAGLKAKVDTKGLKDDVTDFTNISSSGEESGSSSGLAGGEGQEIDSLVQEIVGSETDELKKCKLVHGWLKSNVRYSGYECSRYHSAKECLKNKSHLNCADTARLTRAMMASAGLKCYVVHRTTNGGHFWVIIEIGGKKYASDQTGSGSEFNTVWARSGRTSVTDGGSYTRKNGDNPDC